MSCLIMTPQIREIAKSLNMNPEECKDWIGYWQEQTGTNLEAYPTTKELNSFIRESMKDSFSIEEEVSNYERGEQGPVESIFGPTASTSSTASTSTNNPLLERGIEVPKVNIARGRTGKVVKYNGLWTRSEVASNTNALYVFTDNTNRSSGRYYRITRESKYSKKYNPKGIGDLYFPRDTTARIRGLDNAVPITTQRYYDPKTGRTRENGRWEKEDFDEFKKVIDDDIATIEAEWNNGNYTEIVFPSGDGLFNAPISQISLNRTPLLYHYLYQRVADLINAISGTTLVSPIAEEITEATGTQTVKESAQTITDILSSGEVVPTTALERVYTLFSPQVRRDRVSLIARLFSKQLSLAAGELQQMLDQRISNSDESAEIKAKLQKERDAITNLSALQELKPAKIFERVYQRVFKDYIDKTDAQRVAIELKNKRLQNSSLSQEEKLAEAKRRAAYKLSEYQKIVGDAQVFKALCQEACKTIATMEGVDISINYASIKTSEVANEDIDEENTQVDESDVLTKEEEPHEGWMFNFRNISSKASLSQSVRKTLSTIPKVGYDGRFEYDDLGFQRQLDPDYAHATIIDALRQMTSVGQMIPLLRRVANKKPWINQVLKRIDPAFAKNKQDAKERERLFTDFYTNFRKDFVNYSITKLLRTNSGNLQLKTIIINNPEGTWFLTDEWRDNFNSGTILTKDSIYDTIGTIKMEAVSRNLEKLIPLQKIFADKRLSEIPSLLEQKDENGVSNFTKIKELLNAIGINTDDEVLNASLIDEDSPVRNPTTAILTHLNYILSGIKGGKLISQQKIEEEITDTQERTAAVMDIFKSAYNSIAQIISNVTEDAVESSVMENGKSYYSHNTPNYLGKLMKLLKNSANMSEDDFRRFINDNYAQIDWFKKDGRWLNHWLSLLDTTEKTGVELKDAEEIRKGLNHKVTLNVNKQPYSRLDTIDYLSLLISDYFSEPEGKAGERHWAWYYVPVMSDKSTAEAIRFIKYKTEFDPTLGRDVTYEERILEALKDVVLQEYNRIQLVRARNNNPNIRKIGSFDKRGLEFCFFPALNDYHDQDGKSFLDTLEEMLKENNNTPSLEVEDYIKEALAQVIDEGFEEDFKYMTDAGLLTESEGKYRYLSFHFRRTQGTDYNDLIRKEKPLRRAKDILMGANLWEKEMDTLYENLRQRKAFSTRWANNVLNQIKEALDAAVALKRTTTQQADDIKDGLVFRNYTKEGLREYYWNSKLATSQIIQLTTTDLAYYESEETFQKRFAEIHSPSQKLNTQATYKGEVIGKEFERTLYLEDEEIVSEMVNTTKEWVEKQLANGEITNLDAASTLAKIGYSNYTIEQKDEEGNVVKTKQFVKYGKGEDTVIVPTTKINVADGQAYRWLDSYRCVCIMGGQPWTDAMENSYQRITRNEWSLEDLYTVFQPFKPFVFTQVVKKSGIQNAQGEDIKIKVPVQHKNSEFLLLTIYDKACADLGKANKLRALNQFMKDFNIDVIQFESAVKVGKQGVVSLKGLSTEQEVYNKLKEITKAGTTEEDPDIIQTISYEDYGIQQNVPEHLMDSTVQLIGTQLRKIITADISDNAVIDVDGRSMTKKEALDLYNAINTENIIESFTYISNRFKDPKAIEELLQEEIRTNPRYGNDLQKACTLDENGNFRIPLYDPIQSNRVQELLNSVIRGAVTRQKIRGGSAVQASSYGLSEGLHILYGTDKAGNTYTKGWEVMLPATSRELFEACMDENGKLDVEKLPEDLRKGIGYRIPTEGKYSLVPIYIKGFLPQSSGAAIMLPAEITAIADSDFDVDKLYLMLPVFRPVYNIDQAWYDFYNLPENKDIVAEIEHNKDVESFLKKTITSLIENPEDMTSSLSLGKESRNYEYSETAQERFAKWFNEHKEYYDTGRVAKVDYNFGTKENPKRPQDNSRAARNNLFIDLIYGILTNSDTVSKLYNPGGFNRIKKVSRIIRLLESGKTEKELRDILKTIDIESVQEALKDKKDLIEVLTLIDLNTLTELTDTFTQQLDPLSIATQTKLQQRNMVGANLIGIYANQNVNHALLQHTDAELTFDTPFILNGETLTSLNDLYNLRDELISKNTAEFVGASVDNAKDPVLSDLNQNTFTANMTSLLVRLGYSIQEAGLFMKQPAIVEVTQNYFRQHREGVSIPAIIEDCLHKYDEILKNVKEEDKLDEETTKKINSLDIGILSKNIIYGGLDDLTGFSTKEVLTYYESQRVAIEALRTLIDMSTIVENCIRAMKSDTVGGGAGPTFGDTRIKMANVERFEEDYASGNFHTTGLLVRQDLYKDDMSIDELREELLKSPIPYMQAFYTLGVEGSQKLIGAYFPQLSPVFTNLVRRLENKAKYKKLDAKTINDIYNNIFTYYLSGEAFFGGQNIGEKHYSSYQKRNIFINQFAQEFNKIKKTHPEIGNLPFIRQLNVVKPNSHRPVPTISFSRVGNLSSPQKENFQNDWNALLYMVNADGTPNNVARNMAVNLFLYNYFRNGFAFGSNSFMHLATVELKLAVPGYIDALNKIVPAALTDEYAPGFDEFVDQYIYNHLDNRKLVPEIPENSEMKFFEPDPKTGEDSDIVRDKVSITITEKSTYADKSVVIEVLKGIDGNDQYLFFDYVCKTVKGKSYYYRRNNAESDGNTAVYDRIDPLGWKNNFLEYEFGVPVEAMKSVIAKNDRNYVPPKSKEEQQIEAEMRAMSKSGGYNVQNLEQEYVSYEGVPEGTTDSFDPYSGVISNEILEQDDESLATPPPTSTSKEHKPGKNIKITGSFYRRTLINEAYKSMFGEELDLDNLTKVGAFDNIDENFECLDADGLPLCK